MNERFSRDEIMNWMTHTGKTVLEAGQHFNLHPSEVWRIIYGN